MANFNIQHYANQGYRAPYNPNRGYQNFNRNNYQVSPVKKRSGCKSGRDRNDNPYFHGWKYDRQNGLRTFLAVPYKNTQEHTSKSGRLWENWMCKIRFADGNEKIVSCLRDVQNNKIIIPDLGYVMNPKGGYGGYTGRFYYTKNNRR